MPLRKKLQLKKLSSKRKQKLLRLMKAFLLRQKPRNPRQLKSQQLRKQ